MSKLTGLTKRITAMLLSGILIIGLASGSVFAASTDADPGQISEVAQEVPAEDISEEPESVGATSEENYSEEASADEAAIEYYTVILDANGGYFENEWDDAIGDYVEKAEVINKLIPVGGTLAVVPAYNAEGVIASFLGWSLERDGELVTTEEEYASVDSCILYAVWRIDEIEKETAQVSDDPGTEEDSEAHDTKENNSEESEEHENETAVDDYIAPVSEEYEESDDNVQDLPVSITDDSDTETVTTDSENSDAGNIIRSGECAGDVIWVLTGTNPDLEDRDLTLTISGTGDIMPAFSNPDWTLYNSVIGKVVIENGVTGIGPETFSGFKSLETITIPNTVTKIDREAFFECSKLEKITIPDGVKSIGDNAFYKCSSLTSVTIPDGVTRIGDYTFYDCSSLTSVTIPDSVTSIGYKAFDFCSSLTSITIPDNVTSIGEWAFSWCESLTSVTIPDGVTSIGDSTFYNCSNLTKINISENVTIIGPSAFCGCGITNMTIPDGVTSIGAKAFGYCNILKSISIPNSVTIIGAEAFINCNRLTSVTIPDGVTNIFRNTFYECSSLTSVTIPDSVTSIGFQAFYKCSSLASMTIPDNVDSIDKYAFYNCSSLTSVTIPGSVTSIGESAFQGCSSLTRLEISDSVNGIGKAAFSYCSSLTSVTIPDSVTTIGEDAFSGCTSLTKAVIPFSVTSIGKYAFYQRDSHFPSSNNPIENLTIYGYTGSYAEQYANENGIPFIAINGMSWIDDIGIPHYYTIALQATSTGCFITCDVGTNGHSLRYKNINKPALNADAKKIGAFEKFELVICSNRGYALRSVVNRQFLTYNCFEGLKCDADFVNADEMLTLTKGSRGVIKFANSDHWLCVKDGKLDVTNDINKAEVFNQILVDNNSYTEEELSVLSQDEWFDLYCQGNDNSGYYNIQCNVGDNTAYNAITLKALGYSLMNTADQLGKRDYIEIDKMQCFVAYKIINGKYDVIIAFQGTNGYGFGDQWSDIGSNVTGGTYTDDSEMHQGYHEMAEKLHKKETSIYDETETKTLYSLILDAIDGKAHFTILGHSMGGAIAQCYAIRLANKGIPKDQITGRTFNSALAINYDDKGFEDWYNLCVSSDSVCNGLVVGSIIDYGVHRIGKTIWLYDINPDEDNDPGFFGGNIALPKHNMDACLHTILHNIWETQRCRHNWDAGNTTVVATDQRNGERTYTCSKCDQVKIETLPAFGSFKVTGLKSKTYTGKAITQTPVLKNGDKILEAGTDYVVSYKNNTNAGTATVTITGKGSYTGTITKTFTISRANQALTLTSAASTIDVGKTTTVKAGGAKETSAYTFSSSNTNAATVSASGVVTGKAAGTVTITVKTPQTKNYNAGSKTVKITVKKVLKKPGNCHFAKWNNAKFTNCQIAWNKVDGADGYQTLLSWTDGSHASSTYTKSNVLYRNCTVHPQHVSQMKVRAYYTQNGRRKFGPWSNVEYITPSPTTLTTKNASVGSNLKMNVSWNIIYGCNGYNVFITTNPNGKWYWYQSTAQNATARSSVITKCGGAKLKKNTRYYVRIVTRRKRNGVFCTVPMPSNNAYTGTFFIK